MVVLVKPDCHIEKGALHVGDRIITVCGIPVTGLEEVPVKDVFSQVKSPVVDLQVSVMNRADPGTQVRLVCVACVGKDLMFCLNQISDKMDIQWQA